MRVRMVATFDKVRWSHPLDSEDPEEWGGFVDPANPWGSSEDMMPDGCCGDAARKWIADNAAAHTAESLWDAAVFVLDFPGAVWDYAPDCDDELDTDGAWKRVTLHVKDHAAAVFALADAIAAMGEDER